MINEKARQNRERYELFLGLTRGPSLIIPVSAILLLLLSYRFLNLDQITAFIAIGVYEFIALLIAGLIVSRKINDRKVLTSAGAFTGLLTGVTIGFFKLLWYHKFWTVINLIAEPAVTAVLGFIAYVVVANIKRIKSE